MHLTKIGTNILLTTFLLDISNIFQWQCVLCSTDGEATGSYNFAGYKTNSKKFCAETIKVAKPIPQKQLQLANFCTP